jgi:hypothetical protein
VREFRQKSDVSSQIHLTQRRNDRSTRRSVLMIITEEMLIENVFDRLLDPEIRDKRHLGE